MQFCLITGIRFGYRYITLERTRMAQVRKEQDHTNGRNIMVIGAGDAGKNLVRELKTSGRINGTLRCIIDDNRNKWGRNIEDVPIVGEEHLSFQQLKSIRSVRSFLQFRQQVQRQKERS